jgi:hypothetical protein
MEALEKAFQQGVWAIASTMAGKYIGQLGMIGNDDGRSFTGSAVTKDYFIAHLTNPIIMRWPLEFSVMQIPMQVQTPEGPQLVVDRQIQAMPIGRCMDVEHLTIHITPVDLFFFDDMPKSDAEWYRNLIRNSIQQIMAKRLAESNIVIPGVTQVRRGTAGTR